ncbi:MAG: hypothetical protein WCQ70_07450 [Lentimicrobiaceae bacterium]
MGNVTIERFGRLEKEEVLECLESERLIPNACLLESQSPFRGYYERFTYERKPLYLYLVLEGNYSLEKIWRIILKVRKCFPHKFDAVPGYLEIFDNKVQIIRIRDLEEYDHIVDLQKLFAEEGLLYHKKIRKISGDIGIVRLDKSFYLEPIGDMMYMDAFQPHHGYFIIPRHFSWKEFKKITAEVQFDTNLLYFDAASAFFYENQGIIDMVRIYRENLDRDKLFAIRNGYYEVINNYADKIELV